MIVKSIHNPIVFAIKTAITYGWCWLTNAEAVFIANSYDKSKFQYVKVARIDNTHPDKWRKIVYLKRHDNLIEYLSFKNAKLGFEKIHVYLDPDKTILMSVNGTNYSNNWFYVNEEKRVEQILKNQYVYSS